MVKNLRTVSFLDFSAERYSVLSSAPTRFAYDVEISVFKRGGFDPELKFVKVDFSYGACDIEQRQVFVSLYNGRLTDAFTVTLTNSADYDVEIQQLYCFPENNQGKRNTIFVLEELIDKETKTGKLRKAVAYSWENGKFSRGNAGGMRGIPPDREKMMKFYSEDKDE